MSRWLIALSICLASTFASAAELQIGAGKTDVTPTTPIRLSGYAARKTESQGVEHHHKGSSGASREDRERGALRGEQADGAAVENLQARRTRQPDPPGDAIQGTATRAVPLG